jgi:hypothetical protein
MTGPRPQGHLRIPLVFRREAIRVRGGPRDAMQIAGMEGAWLQPRFSIPTNDTVASVEQQRPTRGRRRDST